ncbi:MAG: dienelactone hydrolase family protein [Candidatus Lokiarchaeota archaeon]|nr:dienelactone hydrolase family protein [Candidatus Lokiarchaeota archaeon]
MLEKFIANSVAKPGHSPVFSNPKDFGFEYEDVTFKASDGITLSGWLIKGKKEKVIIFTHFGMQSSRSGYTPKGKGVTKPYKKEINYLNTMRHLIKEGYTVLMYDLRNHGNSEKGIIEWIAGGVEEYKDVLAAVNFISTHNDYKDSNIGLLSYCMGANSTTYAYGIENGLQEYKNIKALIANQPIVISDFIKGYGFSEKKVRGANEINLERGGVDFYASCLSNVKNITVPTLVVQAEGDPWANLDWVKEYYNELKVEKEMYWIKGTTKRLESYDWFSHSPKKMLEFFKKYL